MRNDAKRNQFIYQEQMSPCPKCGSHNMKPQTPVKTELTGDETAADLVRNWARQKREGESPLEGPVYFMCWDCFHKGPAVDCTGRTSEDVAKDPVVYAEMKRLWNSQ